jgi:hypothetical protein
LSSSSRTETRFGHLSVMKNCKYRGCRTSPRCHHEWFFDAVEHKGTRHSMRVNIYAALHGATHPVTSKQEAREVWEPRYKLDIIAGRDPRRGPALPVDKSADALTIAEFIDKWYLPLYVDVEPLKAARAIRSNCAMLRRLIGEQPLKALEGKEPVDAVKRAYAGHALSTRNRMLSRVRHMTNWARGRETLDVTASPFHRNGIRISAKQEVSATAVFLRAKNGRSWQPARS